MKKRVLFLAGLLLVSASAFAGTFRFTNEVKLNDETNYRPDGRKKTEWTLAKGSYKTESGLKLIFDVDRDFVRYKKAPTKEEYQGWDTYAGVYQDIPSFDLMGLTFKNSLGADFYWDKSEKENAYEETEAGLAWKTSTKLTDTRKLAFKFWGRHIQKEKKNSYDESDIVYGIEADLTEKFNKNWRFSASLDGYWGGYSDGGSTFYNGRDAFNYEASTALNYFTPLYEYNNFKLYFATAFATYWYGQGDDYAGSSTRYTKTYVRPETGIVYDINDSSIIYVRTRYNILGQYAFDNNTTRDANEWESMAGFSFKF